MIKFFILLATSLILAATQEGGNLFFRKDYTMLSNFGAFYKYHKAKLNFSDAVATCTAEGAELFAPTSGSETDAIFKFINKPDVTALWIGIHDLFGEGTFVTLSGQPVDDMYSNWGPGEPNNVNNEENCANVHRDTTYNDVECNYKYNFVCRRNTANLTQNQICETYDQAYFYATETDKCYKMHTTPMKWREAFRICRAEESHLVIINSEAEAQILIREFNKHPEKSLNGNFDKGVLHIGFNDLINPGVYLTIQGQPLSETGYEKWSPTQPDNYLGVEHCGSVFRDGTLNDVNCNNRAMFVCEKPLSNSRGPVSQPSQLFSVGGAVVKLPDAR